MNVPTMVLEDGQQIAVVHLVSQVKAERQVPDGLAVSVVDWRIACTPGLQDLHGTNQRLEPWQRSEDIRAVTCPLCKRTAAYRNVRLPEAKPPPKIAPSDVMEQAHVENIVVHLAVQEKAYLRTACGSEGKQRSEDTRAVSCSHCKASEDYTAAKSELKRSLEKAWR